jgi:hypothetical protein
LPTAGVAFEAGQRRVERKRDAARARSRHEGIAHVASAVRSRKELSRVLLERKWNAKLAFEKRPLLGQRP